MSKTKSIAERIADLQVENERLKKYEKLISRMCEIEFGLSRNELPNWLIRRF